MHNHTWHSLTIEEVFDKLGITHTGLNTTEIDKRAGQYGPNSIPSSNQISALSIFVSQFLNPLILLLILAVALSLMIHEYVDATVVSIIVTLNILIGFVQEYRAEKAIEEIKKIQSKYANVIRNGLQIKIKAEEILPGDIVVITAGDQIPSDLRLTETVDLKIDESVLTGESAPQHKSHDITVDQNTSLADRSNMAFSGSIATQGRGKGVTVATGQHTQVGQIAKLVTSAEKDLTPLQKRLNYLAKIFGTISILSVIPVVVLSILQDRTIVEMIEIGVSLAVSAVPSGLSIVITIALAIGIKRMFASNALIRRLPVVEVLGSADVVCSDKTGTITTNQMTLSKIITAAHNYDFSGEGFEPNGDITKYKSDNFELLQNTKSEKPLKRDLHLEQILTNLTLCCDATQSTGDPTERALVVAGLKYGLEQTQLNAQNPRLSEVPFSSDNKYMITQNSNTGIIIKGAVETVLDHCDLYQTNKDETQKLDKSTKNLILETTRSMSKDGLRVLAVAFIPDKSNVANTQNLNQNHNFVFQALIGLLDPPRPEVIDAISACHTAGIRVVMITGDHKNTAQSIASKVGIQNMDQVIEGWELDQLDQAQLSEIVEKTNIYARVTSEHKLKILNALQQNGHVVGMGGDGVNDAPAVKKADIGFSVGSGTDLTREVSDMILLDDNFATIPKAIKEGRGIYQNIRNFLKLLISSNFDEMFLVFTSIFLQAPLFIAPIQILWINLMTDGLPAITLSQDKVDPSIMYHKPIPRTQSIFKNLWVFILAAGFSAYSMAVIVFSIEYQWWQDTEHDPNQVTKAQTMVFAAASMFEMILVFICRTKYFAFGWSMLKNTYLISAVGLSFVILICALYIPFLNPFFDVVPLDASEWFVVIWGVLTFTGILEIFKLVYYRNRDF